MAASLASLDSLPTEILTEIISYITDLKTLYNLITASPEATRIFNSPTMGPEVLEIVLRSSMAPQVYGLIRFVAIVRTSTQDDPPAASLDTFVERANHHTQKSGHMRFHSTAPPLTHTYRGQQPGAIRSILQTARRVACLTPACLAYYRDQWLAASPSHSDDDMRGWAYTTWRGRYAGRPYEPRDVGPPVWVEEHRVARGFWRLQLLYELRRAVSEDRLESTFDEAHRRVSWETLCKGLRYEKEEFLTVSDFVDHVRAEHPGRPWSLPVPSASSREWPDSAPPVAVDEDAGHTWGFLMSQNAVGWAYANMRLRHFPPSPIRGVPLHPFRRLGLFIWDYDKLVKMELMSTTAYPFSAQDGPYKMYTWRSLLSKEVLDEVENGLETGHLRREMRRIEENEGFDF